MEFWNRMLIGYFQIGIDFSLSTVLLTQRSNTDFSLETCVVIFIFNLFDTQVTLNWGETKCQFSISYVLNNRFTFLWKFWEKSLGFSLLVSTIQEDGSYSSGVLQNTFSGVESKTSRRTLHFQKSSKSDPKKNVFLSNFSSKSLTQLLTVDIS